MKRPPRRVPLSITHSWESQAPQYARSDIKPPRRGGIIRWDVPAKEAPVPIRCLLSYAVTYTQPLLQPLLVGILNYYPQGSPYGEEPHDVLVLVHPEHRRMGIGSELAREALRRWPAIDLRAQSYTDSGWSLAQTLLEDA